MFQLRDRVSVMGSLLKKITVASSIAVVMSLSIMVVGLSLKALAGARGSLLIDGSQAFQSIDGFGVNINSASWKASELQPAIDMLIDQLGATIFRVIVDNADWEATNDNGDPDTPDWTAYNSAYTSPKFEALWNTMAYLNQKGITQNLILTVMGPVASWMGGSHIAPAAEDEWVEMISSLVSYARTTRNLQFGLLAPMNEPDWDGIEGPQVDQWQYVRLMQKLVQKLDGLGLSSIRLVGPDTASADAGVQNYFPEMMVNPVLMAKLAHFGLHNYAGYTAHAEAAIRSSTDPGKNLWMTEVTNIWDALPEIAQGAAATLVWEGYDSVYHHAILAGRGTFPPNDAGNGPALLEYDSATGRYAPRKAFYEHMQLFRSVEPGARRIAVAVSNADVDVLAFHHPSTNRLTIVGRHRGSGSLTFSGSLVNLPAIPSLQFYLTDASLNAQKMADVPVVGNAFTVTVTGGSTFTLMSASTVPPSCLGSTPHVLWGRVLSGNAALQGVTLRLRGPNDCLDTTATGGLGLYRFSGLGFGIYALTPEARGCTFPPPEQTIEITSRFTWVPFQINCL
jgi:O-glycosyl hydrolase